MTMSDDREVLGAWGLCVFMFMAWFERTQLECFYESRRTFEIERPVVVGPSLTAWSLVRFLDAARCQTLGWVWDVDEGAAAVVEAWQ